MIRVLIIIHIILMLIILIVIMILILILIVRAFKDLWQRLGEEQSPRPGISSGRGGLRLISLLTLPLLTLLDSNFPVNPL